MLFCLFVAALLLVTILCNAFARIRSVVYTVASAKISGGLRLALITDLHSARYGRQQRRLMARLAEGAPDAVLLCGDIFDGAAPFDNAITFLTAVSEAYPCYFVFGNHEYGSRRNEEIRGIVTGLGIPILEGDCMVLTAGGTSVRIAGVDDLRDRRTAYERQLAALTEILSDGEMFSVLLTHEPQFIDGLLASGADLIVSGHTHGGQWSIPGLMNGLYAPGQGLFPKYAGGLYSFGAQTLVISRGLAKSPLWIPRIFTPRELVLIDLTEA